MTQDMLADEGIDVVEIVAYQLDPPGCRSRPPAAIARLKAAGVTSGIFSGDPVAPGTFTRGDDQDYFPQWIITGVGAGRHDPGGRASSTSSSGPTPSASAASRPGRPRDVGLATPLQWYTGEESPAAGTSGVILPCPRPSSPASRAWDPS